MNNYTMFTKTIQRMTDYIERFSDDKRDIVLKILWHGYIDVFLSKIYGLKNGDYEFLEKPSSIGIEIIKSLDSLLHKELILLQSSSEKPIEERIVLAKEMREDCLIAAFSIKGAFTPILRTKVDWCSNILEMEAIMYSLKVKSSLVINA